MKRRSLLLPLLAVIVAASGSWLRAADTAKRPHIIFILADDMGLGDLGCYGGTEVPTPSSVINGSFRALTIRVGTAMDSTKNLELLRA